MRTSLSRRARSSSNGMESVQSKISRMVAAVVKERELAEITEMPFLVM